MSLHVEVDPRDGAVELGIPEGEEAAVCSDEVVPVAIGSGRDGHDVRDVQVDVRQVAVELGVTERRDSPVGGDHPVPSGGRGGSDAHYWPSDCS